MQISGKCLTKNTGILLKLLNKIECNRIQQLTAGGNKMRIISAHTLRQVHQYADVSYADSNDNINTVNIQSIQQDKISKKW